MLFSRVDSIEKQHDVFISYSNIDEAHAITVEKFLKGRSLSVWRDKSNLSPGQVVDVTIPAALKKAKSVIVLWSSDSIKSDWVRLEADYAAVEDKLVPLTIPPFSPRD